jgi:hypothetical protein
MQGYGILTNRKRAIVALVHSIVFLLIALRSLAVGATLTPIWTKTALAGPIAILCIYLIVSSVLIWLVSISRGAKEKLYFGFCATSATLGLLRSALGDPGPGLYLRAAMLICAVTTGVIIVRGHATQPATEVVPAFSELENEAATD